MDGHEQIGNEFHLHAVAKGPQVVVGFGEGGKDRFKLFHRGLGATGVDQQIFVARLCTGARERAVKQNVARFVQYFPSDLFVGKVQRAGVGDGQSVGLDTRQNMRIVNEGLRGGQGGDNEA